MPTPLEIKQVKPNGKGFDVIFHNQGDGVRQYRVRAKKNTTASIRSAIRALERRRHKAGVECWCGANKPKVSDAVKTIKV